MCVYSLIDLFTRPRFSIFHDSLILSSNFEFPPRWTPMTHKLNFVCVCIRRQFEAREIESVAIFWNKFSFSSIRFCQSNTQLSSSLAPFGSNVFDVCSNVATGQTVLDTRFAVWTMNVRISWCVCWCVRAWPIKISTHKIVQFINYTEILRT